MPADFPENTVFRQQVLLIFWVHNAKLWVGSSAFIQFALQFPQVTVRNLCDAAPLVCEPLGFLIQIC